MTWALRLPIRIVISLVLTLVIATSLHQTAFADAVNGGTTPNNGIASITERWLRYRAIVGCYSAQDVGNQGVDTINSGTWFKARASSDVQTTIGYLNNDAKVSCGDGDMVTNSLSKIGFTSNLQSVCEMTAVTTRGGVKSDTAAGMQNCLTGNSSPGDFDMSGSKDDQASAFKDAKGRVVSDSAKIPYDGTGAIKYWVGLQSLKTFCGGTRGVEYTDSMAGNVRDSKRKVVVNEVDLVTGDVIRYVYDLDKDEGDTVNDIWANTGLPWNASPTHSVVNSTDLTCSELAQLTWTNDTDFATFVKAYNTAHPDDVPESGASGSSSSTGNTEPVCEVSGFGWVICPLINLMQEATDTVAGFLDDYLQLEPLTTSTTSTLYQGWSNMLGIANILLIFAFMFLIFSQATSVGISNYGIKKMLPRIIAAAIFINLSYYICAVMVDISNILGAGVADLIYNNLGSIADANNSSGFVGGIRKFTDAALTGIFAASGIVVVLFFFLVPAVIAMLTIFVVVAARSAIITLLIIIAPIAFAAWVLPNTEKYFKKWWGLFVQMLVVYPAIMAMFAAASAAANIVVSSSGTSPTDNPGPGNFFPLLIGLIIQALPLLALPALIKLSSGALGRIENMTRSGIKKYGGDGIQDRVATMRGEANSRAIDRLRGRQSSGRTGARSAGFAAWAIDSRGRKAAYDERKSALDASGKARFGEQALRDPQGNWARIADRKQDVDDRVQTSTSGLKARYDGSASQYNADGGAANDRSQRALDKKLYNKQTENAGGRQQQAYNTRAVQQGDAFGTAASDQHLEGAALTAENKALDQALDKRVKRQRNSGGTPEGQRIAAAEAQSRTNEVQLSNLDDDFQLVYEQDRNANPGGAASRSARRQKVVKKNLETTTTDFDAAFDRDAAIALETNTGPAIAQAAAAAIAAANTSKATAEGAAADLKAVYDSGTAAAISGAAAPAWATAAAVAAAAKTASTTRSGSQETRVKGSLKREAAANPTGALGLAEQESIRVNKDLGNAEGDIKAQYDESVARNPNSADADLAREEIAIKERQDNATSQFSTEFDEKRIDALRTGTGPQYALDAADRLETKEDLSERKSNVDLEGKTIRAEEAAKDTASTAAQNAARKFQLDQRNVGATAQQNLNIADRVDKDPAFVKEAAGVRGQRDEARIRGLATQTVVKDKAQEVEIHTDMLNRNGALLAKEGISFDPTTDQFIDLKAGGIPITEDQAAARIKMPPGSKIDVTTRAAAKYAGDNKLMTTDAGVRSIAGMLAKTGALDSTHIQSLVKDLGPTLLAEAQATNPGATMADVAESLGFTVDYINSQASAAGMKHLSYNNVKPDGTLEIGGMFGGLNGAANRVLSEGVSKITKEMYSDEQFGPVLAQKILELETTQPDSFDAELTHMSPRQIEFLVKAQLAAGIITPPTTDGSGAPLDAAAQKAANDAAQKAAVDSYTTRQSNAKERFGSTG